MEHTLEKLEAKIRAHDQKAQALAGFGDQLFPIIHRPGWTTPAEWAFLEMGLEAADAQLEVVSRLRAQLVQAAQLVGEG